MMNQFILIIYVYVYTLQFWIPITIISALNNSLFDISVLSPKKVLYLLKSMTVLFYLYDAFILYYILTVNYILEFSHYLIILGI